MQVTAKMYFTKFHSHSMKPVLVALLGTGASFVAVANPAVANPAATFDPSPVPPQVDALGVPTVALGAIGKPLFGAELAPVPGRTPLLEAIAPAGPAERRAQVASLVPLAAPRIGSATLASDAGRLQKFTLAAPIVARGTYAPAAAGEADRSAGLVAARASPRVSQIGRYGLTERGIEFDTIARIDGVSRGRIPLLIADGKNISVRLGDVLALVEPLMQRSVYDALSASKNAGEYVTFKDLRASGIAVRLDARDQLILGPDARSAGPATPSANPSATPAAYPSATAAAVTPEPRPILGAEVGLYVDSLTESADGSSLANTTSLSLLGETTVRRWKLSVDASYKVARGGVPSLAEQRRSGRVIEGGKNRTTYRTAGFTDARLSAERSFRLVGKLKLDLLGRVTLPIGSRGTDGARGRYEAMADAGLSVRIGPADIWAGGAHRFRTGGFYTPGRDISELYAGGSTPLGERTTARVDFLLAQSPYRGNPVEKTLSAGVSHSLPTGITLDVTAMRFRDSYGRGFRGGMTLRMPMSRL